MKVFIDTNIFLRFLVADIQKQHADCVKLIKLIQNGALRPYTSGIVFLELNYVLTKTYSKSKRFALEKILILQGLRNLTIVEKADTKGALDLYKEYNIKLGDCFIAVQIPNGVTLLTYDRDFKKIKSLSIKTPAEVIKDQSS